MVVKAGSTSQFPQLSFCPVCKRPDGLAGAERDLDIAVIFLTSELLQVNLLMPAHDLRLVRHGVRPADGFEMHAEQSAVVAQRFCSIAGVEAQPPQDDFVPLRVSGRSFGLADEHGVRRITGSDGLKQPAAGSAVPVSCGDAEIVNQEVPSIRIEEGAWFAMLLL